MPDFLVNAAVHGVFFFRKSHLFPSILHPNGHHPGGDLPAGRSQPLRQFGNRERLLREQIRDLPEELDELVMDLLDREPTRRPSAIALLGRLDRLRVPDWDPAAGEPPPAQLSSARDSAVSTASGASLSAPMALFWMSTPEMLKSAMF